MSESKLSSLVLKVNWIPDDKVLELENELIDNFCSWLDAQDEYSISLSDSSELIIYAEWRSKFADYINEGKFVKEWLLKNSYISDRSDNSRFSLRGISDSVTTSKVENFDKKTDDVDKLIYIVPSDDPHLVAVQDKLKSLRAKKKFNI